jgi:hypothetical protein
MKTNLHGMSLLHIIDVIEKIEKENEYLNKKIVEQNNLIVKQGEIIERLKFKISQNEVK